MPFRFSKTEIDGVVLIQPEVFEDRRGFFMETYKESAFAAAGLTEPFIQENQSRSKEGTLRGLHYQIEPKAQGKLVRVISGEIYDVAVDIRQASATYGKWVAYTLSAENRSLLYIPPGCAHGFCVVSSDAEVIYKMTNEYAPDYERGIPWNDRSLNISWPIKDPIISDRDGKWPSFDSTRVSERIS
jgi:dTDP-4-dehydrorhamnose 3,5-epimerase